MHKYKKYLPSKKFSIMMGSIVFVLLLTFGLFYYFSKKQTFKTENSDLKVTNALTESKDIVDLIGSDTDNDGVLDWEEALWGTDKNKRATFEGKSDASYIAEKKKALNIETDLNNEKNISETDLFAREFFTAYTALKASGQVDSNTINEFSSVLGERVSNPNLVDIYTTENIKYTLVDSDTPRNTYYNTLKKYFDQQSANGLGDEINIISGGLLEYAENGSEGKYEQLNIIADSYKEFAKKVISTPVPEGLATIHLKIANSAYNTGISVGNMTKITSDPIIGISGLSQYEQYSEALIQAVADLDTAIDTGTSE